MSEENNFTCEHCGKIYKSLTSLKAHQGYYPSKPASCKVIKEGLGESLDKPDDTPSESFTNANPNEIAPTDPKEVVGFEEVIENNINNNSTPEWMEWKPSSNGNSSGQTATHRINPAVSLFKKQMDSTIDSTVESAVDPKIIKEMNSSIIKLIPPITDVALSSGAKVLSDGKVDLVKHSDADRKLFSDTLEMYADANDMNLAKHASPGLLLSIVSANYIGVPLWEAARESPITMKQRIGNFGLRFRIPLLKKWAKKNNTPDFLRDGIAASATTGAIPGGDL